MPVRSWIPDCTVELRPHKAAHFYSLDLDDAKHEQDGQRILCVDAMCLTVPDMRIAKCNVCEILSVIVKKNWYFLVLTIFIELNLCDCSFIELIYLKRVV